MVGKVSQQLWVLRAPSEGGVSGFSLLDPGRNGRNGCCSAPEWVSRAVSCSLGTRGSRKPGLEDFPASQRGPQGSPTCFPSICTGGGDR